MARVPNIATNRHGSLSLSYSRSQAFNLFFYFHLENTSELSRQFIQTHSQ
jgi:hypothetical protein